MNRNGHAHAIGRRGFILGVATMAAGAAAMPIQPSTAQFERIRNRLGPGAGLGVGIYDGSMHRVLGFDLNSRYPLASTFKVPLVAAILSEVDRGVRSLSDRIAISSADIVAYAPIVRRNVERGHMSVANLCAAALKESDNSAANLLLRTLGGPEAFNAFVRGCGDSTTRLDRYEPELNAVTVDDERDSTTPAAMAVLAHRLFFGDVLSYESRGSLLRWNGNMIAGRRRAAADEPPGSGPRDQLGVVNGELWSFDSPGEHERLTIVSFIRGGNSTPPAREAAHATVGQLIIASLNTPPRSPDPFP